MSDIPLMLCIVFDHVHGNGVREFDNELNIQLSSLNCFDFHHKILGEEARSEGQTQRITAHRFLRSAIGLYWPSSCHQTK